MTDSEESRVGSVGSQREGGRERRKLTSHFPLPLRLKGGEERGERTNGERVFRRIFFPAGVLIYCAGHNIHRRKIAAHIRIRENDVKIYNKLIYSFWNVVES